VSHRRNQSRHSDSYFTLPESDEELVTADQLRTPEIQIETGTRSKQTSIPPGATSTDHSSIMSSLSITPNTPTYMKGPDWYGNTEGRYMLLNFGTFGKKVNEPQSKTTNSDNLVDDKQEAETQF